jgi:hypothetical protein
MKLTSCVVPASSFFPSSLFLSLSIRPFLRNGRKVKGIKVAEVSLSFSLFQAIKAITREKMRASE